VRLEIGSIRCVVDVELTRRIFSRLSTGGAEKCGCLHCRNFALARDLAFPRPLRIALESAGIDWRKESEAVHYYRDPNVGHIYDVWVNFIGFVENGDPFAMPADHDAGPTVQITAYNDAERYAPKPALFNNDRTVGRIEVRVGLPWVLAEPDPEIETTPTGPE
jgi:hypothetical protein